MSHHRRVQLARKDRDLTYRQSVRVSNHRVAYTMHREGLVAVRGICRSRSFPDPCILAGQKSAGVRGLLPIEGGTDRPVSSC